MKKIYRVLLTLLILAILIAASWQSAMRGASRYYVYKAERSGSNDAVLQRALTFDPANPDIYQLRGLASYANGAFAQASSEFDRAIGLRPSDFTLRLYRARARDALGDLAGAESDYRDAISLAPYYAAPQNELGRFLLRAHRVTEAFVYLQRAASIDETLLPDLLDLARATYPGDALAIVRAVDPVNEPAKTRTVLYLIQHGLASEELASFAAENLDDAGLTEAVRELIKLKKFHMAFEMWKKKHERNAPTGVGSNLVVSGDFENFCCGNTGGFGWQVEHSGSKLEIAISDTGGVSNSRGLEITFNGDPDTGPLIIQQLIPVRPQRSYTLTLLTSSPERLVSGGLPIFSVMDAANNSVIAESGPLGSTDAAWHRVIIDFSIPANTEGILIGLRRSRCQSSPCPIFGKLRLDDVVLTLRTAHQ